MRVTLRPHDMVLGFTGAETLRLDGEGRWCTMGKDGTFYRRTVDGDVVARARSGALRALAPSDAGAVHDEVRRRLSGIAAMLTGEPWPFEGSVDRDALAARLELALAWDRERLDRERERFRQAYPERVPILPPDRYRDVVVLPAVGCPNAHCSFCAFYGNARFSPLPRRDLEAHVTAVARFFGRALPGRTGIFLGSASALSLGQTLLISAMDVARQELGDRPRGFAAFADPDHAPRRGDGEYRDLAARGLRMVTIGLETGWPELRARLGKSADLGPVAEMVCGLGAAGIPCGLSILAGIAPEAPRRHVEETASLVRSLPLGPADIVYLSPLDASGTEEAERELLELRDALVGRTPARVAPYRIDLFRYYA